MKSFTAFRRIGGDDEGDAEEATRYLRDFEDDGGFLDCESPTYYAQ